jgi:hypothetical protein
MPLYMPPGSPIPTSTFATLPTAPAVGSQIYVTDVGEYGAVYTAKNGAWTHTGEIEVIQKAKGWLVPSLAAANAATYSQTGTTITVTSTGHNIPDVVYNSKDVYLNMGTAATGAIIPPGWFSNFTYVSADSFTCTSTVSQTGTGAVNTNIAETVVGDLNATILGGALGLNGKLSFSFLSSNNNSGNNKTVRFNFATNPINYNNTTVLFRSLKSEPISNRNNQSSQVLEYGGAPYVYAVDTSVDFTCGFALVCAAANDYVAIHSASFYISPS